MNTQRLVVEGPVCPIPGSYDSEIVRESKRWAWHEIVEAAPPESRRYAIDGWQIREGVIQTNLSLGTGVNWGEGINYTTRGYATRDGAEAALAAKCAKLDERRRIGAEKFGARKRAWAVRRGASHEVYLGQYGDLMSAQGWGVVAYWDSTWPKLYDSPEAAETGLEQMRAHCAHSWQWLSHEERECRKCGEIQFLPDLG